MTNAEVWFVAPNRAHRKVARLAAAIPPDDEQAWLLQLRDWCRAQPPSGLDLRDYEIRVPDRRTVHRHSPH